MPRRPRPRPPLSRPSRLTPRSFGNPAVVGGDRGVVDVDRIDRSKRRRAGVALLVVASLGAGALLSACGAGTGTDRELTLSEAGRRGQTAAKEQGCTSCHTSDGSKASGPTWQGLAGSKVTLDDGTEVVADDDYLTTAILAARDQVAKGYPNIMPTYEGVVSDDEVADIIAYLHDLSPEATASN